MLEWNRICCGTDFSTASRLAMIRAAELARRLGGELELVHVYAPAPLGATDMLVTPADVAAMGVVELENTIAGWRSEAERLVGRSVRSTVVQGEPAFEIVRLARERPFDLVVVGTHGRKGLKRLVVGSVAERIVREAPCSVVVVRGAERAEPE